MFDSIICLNAGQSLYAFLRTLFDIHMCSFLMESLYLVFILMVNDCRGYGCCSESRIGNGQCDMEHYYGFNNDDDCPVVDTTFVIDNVIGFDYTVLQPYSDFDLQEINTFDMLVDIKKLLNFRLSLNHLAQHTLNAKKSADGLVSLQWYKEGKIDKIIHYCKQDVEITRDLFLFGEDNGYVNYQSRSGNPLQLEVNWKTDKFVS